MSKPPAVILLGVLVLVLAACSGDQSDVPATSQTSSSTSTSVAAPSQTTTTTVDAVTTTTTPMALPCHDGSGVEGGDAGRSAGDTRVDGCGVLQVWVPAGTFVQGTVSVEGLEPPEWAVDELASEQPAHEVTLTAGYWIDMYEVTNKAFDAFIAAGGYDDPRNWSDRGWEFRSEFDFAGPVNCGGAPDEPRVCITWYEAEAYAQWRGGRLPTESEWEYAARGPASSIYPWGDAWDPDNANVTQFDHLTPVGSYPQGASWVGALDMSGNAMEWVSDWLGTTYYTNEPQVDPQGPESGHRKIEKGGWWGSNPFVARAAYRHFEDPPKYQDHHIGVRVVTPAG